MSQKVKQTVFVFFKGAGADETGFTFNITNIAFQPDTLIVRGVDFQDSATIANNLILLYSDLVGNRPLVSFINPPPKESATEPYAPLSGFMQRKKVYHPINIIPQGTFQFTYKTADGKLADLDGDICIELEFSRGYY